MELETVQKAYKRWAHVYDVVFGPAFRLARRRAIGMLELQPDHVILEIGVGTGLSIPEFPDGPGIYGVDISRPMLERARERTQRPRSGVVEGDAGRMPFADDSFDGALAPFVVSAVPEPVLMLGEVRRVVRPGGRIVLLNHFASPNRVLASFERAINPTTTRLLGFHADFAVEPVLEQAGFEIVTARRVPPLKYWTALSVTPTGAGA